MMMVSAFADRDLIIKAYREAKNNKYGFLSYGDAMMIVWAGVFIIESVLMDQWTKYPQLYLLPEQEPGLEK